MKPDFSKGLIPTILQHAKTNEVLMLGYQNQEAFEKMAETGVAWFYSRSKERLWKKGETSGNIQQVVSWSLDCDQDALLVQVLPAGPTCHTGAVSCFDTPIASIPASTEQEESTVPFQLEDLQQRVQEKRLSQDTSSYTSYLFREGMDKICKKFGEEAVEVILAAKGENRAEVAAESADLLYHLMVLLEISGVTWSNVIQVLAERHQKEGNRKKDRQPIQQW